MATISNVVFDMGGVLMDWNPEKISLALCPDPDDAALLRKAVFDSREWGWVDAGAVVPETVAWTAKLKLPERLHELADVFALRWFEAFDPLPETGELVRELKERGYGVYLLSNAGPTFEDYRARIPAIECFDGVLVSCYEHVVKPDAAIYELFCERYGVSPESCLFIDDMERNVEGARRVVMQGYRFDGDVAALRAFILDAMLEQIPAPREELSEHAPRIITIHIPVDKIREVIGTGGKVVRGIQDETGAQIEILEDGTIHIAAVEGPAGEAAKQMILDIVKEPEVGEVYNGEVVGIKDFGAFIKLTANKDGLLHISRMANGRVGRVEDVLNLGDVIEVKVIDVDANGKISLDRTNKPDAPAGSGDQRRPRGGSDDRRNNGGNRNRGVGNGRTPRRRHES